MAEWRKHGTKAARMSLMAASVEPRAEGDIPDNHKITVRERGCSVDFPTLIQHNVKTDTITLDLDGEWDGLNVILIIGSCAIEGDAEKFIWNGTPITVPSKFTETVRTIDISVNGYSRDGEMRLVTKKAAGLLNVVPGGCVAGGNPTPDVVDFMGQLLEAGRGASEAAQKAENAAVNAQELVERGEDILDGLDEISKALPATTERLGLVKIGDGISVAEDGTISADAQTPEQIGLTPISDEIINGICV